MRFETDYRLEEFILNTRWEDLPVEVCERIKGCFIDLMGALVIGSRSHQFEAGLRLARRIYGSGNIPAIGAKERFSFMGAAAAMGHSSNAYDIDDGHNMTRSHPGTSFVGAVLAAAYEKDQLRNEFLTALLVAYETSIRSGAAIMDYYKYAHSSGTFGAVGVAAGVGRIYGFKKEQINNAISVAEFNAPIVPGIRSVEYPSMNKDGVPFGIMVGTLAVMDTLCGFEGNKNLLESDEYRHFVDDIGKKYQVMNLYFKPYPCCRWAHPAIDACIELSQINDIKAEDIASVTVKTFLNATLLSKAEPKTSDEAQYNIAYPVAAALIHGDFGYAQVREDGLKDPKVLAMMKRIAFKAYPDYDAQFPARRICSVEIEMNDGQKIQSREYEPRGEAHENIGIDWLSDKFRRITNTVISWEGQEKIIDMIVGTENVPIRRIVDKTNEYIHSLVQ